MKIFKRKKQQTFAEGSEVIKEIRKYISEYKGYDDVNYRLESDKMFRSGLVKKLRKISNNFAEIVGKLIEMRLLNAWGLCEKALKELKDVESKLTNPDYRHTTFFDNPNLEGLDITVIYVLETEAFTLLDDMEVLTEEIMGKLREASFDEIDQLVSRLVQLASSLVKLLTDRIELIASFEIIGF